jgi:hypothetical protein
MNKVDLRNYLTDYPQVSETIYKLVCKGILFPIIRRNIYWKEYTV